MNRTDRSYGSRISLRAALIAVVILGAIGEVGSTQPTPLVQDAQSLARSYIDAGYSVVGPGGVVAFTDDTVTLRNPFKDMTYSLRGQTLTVLGPDTRPMSRRSIVPGSNVYVCRKGAQTALILLSPVR